MSVSWMCTDPREGRLRPPIIARKEDLPEPERPTMLVNSPDRTSRSMPLTASISPRSVAWVLPRSMQDSVTSAFRANEGVGLLSACSPGRVERARGTGERSHDDAKRGNQGRCPTIEPNERDSQPVQIVDERVLVHAHQEKTKGDTHESSEGSR